jgi:hypothetical protein
VNQSPLIQSTKFKQAASTTDTLALLKHSQQASTAPFISKKAKNMGLTSNPKFGLT